MKTDFHPTCELYPTIVTPFHQDRSIDYESLGRLIAHFARHGADGIFAVCQSSEMFFLSDEEKLELAAFSIQHCREQGISCVVSGHTQDEIEDQIQYLRALEALSPDAIIFVSNRFASEAEPDDTLIARMEQVTAALSPNTRLGIYECPYPYKRLLTEPVLRAMARDGRFQFIKDTCCDMDIIAQRLSLLKDTPMALYNANGATLLDSLLAGARGYSGIQLNYFPEIFGQLKAALSAGTPELCRARDIADFISATSVMETQNYPANAKYYLTLEGLFHGETTRNGKPPLTSAQRLEVEAYRRQAIAMALRCQRHCRAQLVFDDQAHFPACHASTVLPLDRGEALIAYFAGDHEKADNVGIWLSRRESGLWLPPVRIAKVCEQAHWNPVLMATKDGVRIVFKVGKEIPDWKSYTMVSSDGGRSWSSPVRYANQEVDARGPVRSKPIRLKDGRLLAPNSVEKFTGDGRWTVCVDVSSDEGETFTLLANIPLNNRFPEQPNHISGEGAIQPTLWESWPGRIHALLRTTCGSIFRSDSMDSGKTWCEAYDTGLPNNNSGIDIAQDGDTLYLAMNPIAGNWAARNALIVMKSSDNGKTFTPYRVLEDYPYNDKTGRSAEYSYPAIAARAGTLYVSYTYMRRQIAYVEIGGSE